MAVSSNSGGGGPMAEINVTPLVDVMLVLLIIFMITAPLMSYKVQVTLPEATLENRPEPPIQPIMLAIKDSGERFCIDPQIDRQLLETQQIGRVSCRHRVGQYV